MANRLRGDVTVMLGGEAVTLRPSFAAIMEIEDRLGGIVPLASRAASGDFGLREAAVILWATALLPEGSSRSLDEMGERVLRTGLVAVVPAVRDLLTHVLTGGRNDPVPDLNPQPGGVDTPGKHRP